MRDKNYLTERIKWSDTRDNNYPYQAHHDGKDMLIRVNDFPAEHLYTLIADNREIADFDDWSSAWKRPGLAVSMKTVMPNKKRGKRAFGTRGEIISNLQEVRDVGGIKFVRQRKIKRVKSSGIFGSKTESPPPENRQSSSKSDLSPPKNQSHTKNEK